MYEDQNDNGNSFRNGMNWIGLILQGLSLGMEVILRRRFGERYIGPQGLVPLVAMIFWPAFYPGEDPHPILTLLILYLVMCLTARSGVFFRRWRGTDGFHSRYSGEPRLRHFFPKTDEVLLKRFHEPALVLAVGFLALDVNAIFGSYVITSGVALFITQNLMLFRDRNLTLDLNDAVIEATQRAERFRALGSR